MATLNEFWHVMVNFKSSVRMRKKGDFRDFQGLWMHHGCAADESAVSALYFCQYNAKSMRNVSRIVLNLCCKELWQFWWQKGVQLGRSKVHLKKVVNICSEMVFRDSDPFKEILKIEQNKLSYIFRLISEVKFPVISHLVTILSSIMREHQALSHGSQNDQMYHSTIVLILNDLYI